MEERHSQLVRQTYSPTDAYSAIHKDALATGDQNGKGTGHGGHTHSLPNCNGTLGLFVYSDLDTGINSGAGNCDDNKQRRISLVRSMYNHEFEYAYKNIDSSKNLAEGQYSVNRVQTRIYRC